MPSSSPKPSPRKPTSREPSPKRPPQLPPPNPFVSAKASPRTRSRASSPSTGLLRRQTHPLSPTTSFTWTTTPSTSSDTAPTIQASSHLDPDKQAQFLSLLRTRPHASLPPDYLPLCAFHSPTFLPFHQTPGDVITFPRVSQPHWTSDTPLSEIIASFHPFTFTEADYRLLLLPTYTSSAFSSLTSPSTNITYLPPKHFNTDRDPLLMLPASTCFLAIPQTALSSSYLEYLHSIQHLRDPLTPQRLHLTYNLHSQPNTLPTIPTAPQTYLCALAHSLLDPSPILPLLHLSSITIHNYLQSIPTNANPLHRYLYLRTYLLPLRVLCDHLLFAQHPLRSLLFLYVHHDLIPLLSFSEFCNLLPAYPETHAHRSIRLFNRLIHSFTLPTQYYPLTDTERTNICKRLHLHDSTRKTNLPSHDQALSLVPPLPTTTMANSSSSSPLPPVAASSSTSSSTRVPNTTPPENPLPTTSSPPFSYSTPSPSPTYHAPLDLPPLATPHFSIASNPATPQPTTHTPLTNPDFAQFQQFQLFQQFLQMQQQSAAHTPLPPSLLTPSAQPLTLDSIWNPNAAPPPTIADIQNYTRMNPRTISRYQTDNIVRQLDNLFLEHTDTPHAKDEARALRLLHTHLDHQRFILLLQNFFKRHNSFPFERNTYWRLQASIHVDAWHRPDPEQADLATALTTLTRRLNNPYQTYNNTQSRRNQFRPSPPPPPPRNNFNNQPNRNRFNYPNQAKSYAPQRYNQPSDNRRFMRTMTNPNMQTRSPNHNFQSSNNLPRFNQPQNPPPNRRPQFTPRNNNRQFPNSSNQNYNRSPPATPYMRPRNAASTFYNNSCDSVDPSPIDDNHYAYDDDTQQPF